MAGVKGREGSFTGWQQLSGRLEWQGSGGMGLQGKGLEFYRMARAKWASRMAGEGRNGTAGERVGVTQGGKRGTMSRRVGKGRLCL